MTQLVTVHEDHGAVFTEQGGHRIPAHYGRADRAHLAVRNGVGITEHPFDVVEITGEDRIEYVDNVVSTRVPADSGHGTYALLLDPQGRVRLDLYVFTDEDRLYMLLPPGRADDLLVDWREKVFIQDVSFEDVTAERLVLGVHGPLATEKLASVSTGATLCEERYGFENTTVGEQTAMIVRSDDLAGEEGYFVIADAVDGIDLFDTLLTRGVGACPFGWETWQTLTLEAGSPLLDSEFEERIPNMLGLRHGLDFEKGCFVGQEVVSRIENRGQPNQRLVGLFVEAVPTPSAAVCDGDEAIGEITRGCASPSLDRPIALAMVPFDHDVAALTVRVDGEDVSATVTALPFQTGSADSARLPCY